MRHIYTSFFAFPDGAIWGNLLATLLIEIPLWMLGMWRFEVRHRRQMNQMHNQITQSLKERN